jgi:hypothetical protein
MGYEGISDPAVSFAANSIEVILGHFPLGPAAAAIPGNSSVLDLKQAC